MLSKWEPISPFTNPSNRARESQFPSRSCIDEARRRRNSRLPVQIPVSVSGARIGSNQQALTVDFSEGGMAVQFKYRVREGGALNFAFRFQASAKKFTFKARSRGEPQQSTRNSVCKRRPGPQASSQTWFNQNSAEPDKMILPFVAA